MINMSFMSKRSHECSIRGALNATRVGRIKLDANVWLFLRDFGFPLFFVEKVWVGVI